MRLRFGKHRGETVRGVAARDPDYLRWLLQQYWIYDDLRQNIAWALTDANEPLKEEDPPVIE